MAGAPIPMPVASDKVLCIADLENTGSKKLTATARGMSCVQGSGNIHLSPEFINNVLG